jgi:gamma-glutamyltranspeptidase/glutathione hydrolase
VEAPRFHHQHLPDIVYAEPGTFSEDTRLLLERMGYTIEKREHLGMAAAVMRYADGWFTGWADGVGGGAGTGW